jgi:hypothetical protein
MKKRRYKGRGFWHGVGDVIGFVLELLLEIMLLPFRLLGKMFDGFDI